MAQQYCLPGRNIVDHQSGEVRVRLKEDDRYVLAPISFLSGTLSHHWIVWTRKADC